MKTLILSVCTILLISCNRQQQKSSFLFRPGSSWTFINASSKSKIDYAEIEFKKNNLLVIHSERNGRIGPFVYINGKHLLNFGGSNYTIISNSSYCTLLKDDGEKFIAYKIPFYDTINLDSDQIAPFYLRRCFYLVLLNKITTNEAIKYLSRIKTIPKDSMPKEEIIK